MKFSFVNASPTDFFLEPKKRRSFISNSWPPLGILYLATIIRESGIEISVLDQPGKGFTIEETVKWIEKEDPDILGFTTLSTSGRTAALISNAVKKKNRDITIIFGGYFATFNADRILRKYPSVDIIVRGEGERTIINLVDSLKKKNKLQKVLGLTFRDGNKIVSTPDRPLIEDLDSIPFPDRSLLDVEYHSIVSGANVATKKFTSIISSRGCVHKCRFCCSQKFARNIWRPRSIENILEELHCLKSEGFEQFIFIDDSFTLNQKRVIKICESIRKEKLDFEWICEGRVDSCSYEMMEELARAGCKVIYFGIESATQWILDYYQKKITPQQSEKAVKIARKAGIDIIIGSFILGAPYETLEEIQNTFNFAKKLPIDFPLFNMLTVAPGMDIWNELTMKGLLNEEDYWEQRAFVSKICPSTVPFQDITQMIHENYNHFVFRPKYVLRQVGRLLKSRFRMGILVNNLNRLGTIREESESII